MAFDYYYGTQADQFNFIKIPKTMITDPMFEDLSVNAKLLYGVLLDRMNLSMKNRWFDDENRVYIIYQVAEIMEDFNFSKKTAVKYLNELVEFGLVEKKRRGLGLPSLLYVKSFIIERDYSGDKEDIETSHDNCGNSRGVTSYTSRSVGEETSRGVNITLQEVTDATPLNNKTNSSNTNINNTKNINTNILSYPLTEGEEPDMTGADNWTHKKGLSITMPKADRMGCDKKKSEYELYMDLIKDNIEYDALKERYPLDAELIDGIVEMMTEVTVSTNDYIVIASNSFPKEVVKSRFLKLNFSHLEYVMSCFKSNTTKVKNIKKYLLASLFNAPSTMNGYYTAEVNHDMPQYASRR